MAQCKATGCTKNVNPAYGMCRKHWFMVPKDIQNQLWESVGVNPARNRELWILAVAKVAEKEGVTALITEEFLG